MRYLLLAFFISIALNAKAAENDATRIRQLEEKLRCLVCQNQTLADSNAELAQDLRQQVREQVAAGRSDDEILDYLVQRYGDFVRYEPLFKATTALLWIGPFALLVAASALLIVILRRRRRASAPPMLAPEEKRLVERVLGPTAAAGGGGPHTSEPK